MRRYDSYKDSGVEWLGEVPSHWNLIPNKYIFKLRKNVVGKRSNEYDLLSLSLKGVIKRDMENPEGKFPAEFDTYQEVKEGDFIFCLFDVEETPRTVGLSSYRGMITGAYTIFETNNVDKKFIYYFYLNLDSDKRLKPLYKGLRNTISKETFFSFNTFIPPLSEQQKIAQFLDDKTAKIDQAVDLAEKQIALLKEHKQILIQNAVTRGLNPDVPLKDSGVEWIGQVPEHWEVKRFRNLFDFGKGLSITKENLQDEGIPCVNYGEIHSKYGFEVIPERDALKCVDSKYLVFKNSMLNKGDFVFADTSEDIEGSGNFTYLNSSTRIFAGYHTIITRLKITAIHRYIAYYFDSLSFRNQIRNKVKGVKVFSITQSILKGTFVLLPNLKEQQQIANYLDTQTAKIDQAIALKTAHIEKLKEYKSVLINNVVTGKVQV
ncbi:restriction endonuclease subunit S [Haemophilus haemolyticus]|uniref:restriction endonuclease subunit S n=1 Tax=Haemophilus haemolyticus TaxID=726 RepID=UPI00062D6726|nr:restriction endonuclease subunit S [Haemophilus haemolyticus]KKZ56073.1 restriction endonuclease subunit S [Haemophilus haemolyticus]